jgi:DNA recombination protein RmuC
VENRSDPCTIAKCPPWLVAVAGAILGAAVVAVGLVLRQARMAAEAARLGAELAAARQATDEQRALLVASQTQVREAFAALSKDALRENRIDFLQNAEALFQPVRDTLDRVRAQMTDVDKAREGSLSGRHHRTALARARAGTAALDGRGTVALAPLAERARPLGRNPAQAHRRARGHARAVRLHREPTSTADGARQQPDLIVRLPGQGTLVVDAKVPIDAYLSATTVRSEDERQELLGAHARQVRDHIRALGSKEYWRQFQPAPEFVVMFLPLEPLLSAAFERDGTLLDQSASLRVIPATPMTLLALLRAVAFGWQQQAVARNAEEIQSLGRELYERLATMVDHLEKVGRNIKSAADSYDSFIGSLEQKVLPGARKFRDLGVSTSKQIETPDPINLTVRRVRKDELTGRADEVADETGGSSRTSDPQAELLPNLDL